MTPLERARRIIDLHQAIKGREEYLASIEKARKQAIKLEVAFYANTSSSFAEKTLSFQQGFSSGSLTDIAAIILARLSDEHAAKLRILKSQLADIETGAFS